jgi:hypothetical protein
MDETITATWIVESDNLFALKDEYSNQTNSVSFTITPLSESTWQRYVTYGPRLEE